MMLCSIHSKILFNNAASSLKNLFLLQGKLSKLNKRPFMLAGSASVRGKTGIPILPENGYKDFACLNGLMIDWERDSLPVRKDLSVQLSYSGKCQIKFRDR